MASKTPLFILAAVALATMFIHHMADIHRKIDITSKYCDSQIVDKGTCYVGDWMKFRAGGVVTSRVYVVKYDYDRFNLGDTIPCK